MWSNVISKSYTFLLNRICIVHLLFILLNNFYQMINNIFLKDGQCASGTVVLLLPHIACLGYFSSSNNELELEKVLVQIYILC